MSRLDGRRVLLGVGGGIAAYKAAELVRALRRAGAEVRVVMTASAEEFVQPLTFQALSGHRVGTDLFDPSFEEDIGHIELARWAELVLVAPCTANLLARARAGMADDLLTTILLATTAPVLFCPAMNTQMWKHPAVQENIVVLERRPRSLVLHPDEGELACRETGPGRLPDPDVVLATAERALAGGQLRGKHVVVTAGPTREFFDPVRFLSNPSSGKMGYSLAAAAWSAGADVTLVSGPTSLPAPWGCRVVRVVSASDMRDAVLAERADVLIMAAAVADYTPVERSEHKRKKSDAPWDPALTRTPDILSELAQSPRRAPVVIGFAAETDDIIGNAVRKLESKRLDGIVANSVYGPTGAFGSDASTVTLIRRGGHRHEFGPHPKREVAEHIIEWVASSDFQ
ncbi:MAG: bifunctional phosphopantothenoylcysteine decarboxylase/phosphopantothenate--cysteine ligase CoaBC [Deltaproteobacteria bacterium]|nr:MAG: bifunctional phosphopantothenoylcysteine decarboxylase/phosphopantothenate--cysteine ligase CoaBC [Deltaproteobacteria bacterium]